MAQDLVTKIREAAIAQQVDPDVAVRIAELESSLNPKAKAKTSSAKGLFQVIDDTWKRYGGTPNKQLDPDENIRVGVNVLADNMTRAKRALGRDPRPSELYAMHFFGPDTAIKVINAPEDRPLSALVAPRVLRANPQLRGKTAGEVLAGLNAKFPATMIAAAPVAATTPTPSPVVEEATTPPVTRVSRSVPRPLPAAKPLTQSAELPASYQAALAVSLLAADDEKEKTDENEPTIAEQYFAQPARPSALASLDLSYESPFPAPVEPVRMAKGGEAFSDLKKYDQLRSDNSDIKVDFRPLNFERLLAAKAVRVTNQGFEDERFNEDPTVGFSLVSGYNDAVGQGSGTAKWPDNPRFYGVVKDLFSTRPQDIGAHKYKQIVESAKDMGLTDEDIYLAPSSDFAHGGPVRMQTGGDPRAAQLLQQFKTPPGYQRAVDRASERETVAPIPGIQYPAEFIGGFVGAAPRPLTNPSQTYRIGQALGVGLVPTATLPAKFAGAVPDVLAGLGAMGAAGVIKPKGGNWPARHIQMRLDPIRTPMFRGQDPELRNAQVAEQIDELRGSGASEQIVGEYAKTLELPVAIDKWITNKLGKYIQNEMGTPQDPLRKLAREENITTAPPDLDRERVARYARTQRELAMSLTDYRYRATLPDGKTDTFMTMEDAKNWVAESNIPDRDKAYATINAFVRDENYDEIPVVGLTPEGQPILESGKPAPFLPRQQETGHGLAKYWEDLVDSVVNPFTPGVVKAEIDLVRRGESTTPLGFRADETLAELSRISPRTPIYQLKPHALSELGFTKLTKDLEQMVSEPKLLPQALRIEPKDLDRMSVPDVVKRVDAFKNWQDEQYRKEMLAKAANIPLYKEYDDGARWLRMTDLQDNKENRKYALAVGCDAQWCTKDEDYIDRYTDPKKAFWPRELHVLTSKDGRPLVQVLVELPDPAATGRASRPAIHEIKYRRNEPDIPEIGYGFDRKKVKHEVLSHVQDYIRSGDFRYVDEIGNAKLVDTAPYGDSDFVKRAEDVRRFGWDEQAYGPWQRFVDADSWNEAVARMQMNMRGPQLQLRNPPEEFSEGGSANVPRGTSQTSSKLSRADLEALKKISEKSPEYRDITSYLEASGTPYPEVRADIAAQDAFYDPRSNTVTLNFDAYRQLFDTKNPPPNRTFLHEMTHAAQPALEKQYQEGAKFFAASPKDPEARRVFLQAYEKLRGSGAADLARKLDPTWEKENRKYRSSREELEAFGVGNVQNFGRRGDRLDARGPLHLDPTMATETMLLLDLARRDARLNKPTK